MIDYAEVVASVEHVKSLDPLSPMSGNDWALALWTAHRYAEAFDGFRQTLELEPEFVKFAVGLRCSTRCSAISLLRSPELDLRSR